MAHSCSCVFFCRRCGVGQHELSTYGRKDMYAQMESASQLPPMGPAPSTLLNAQWSSIDTGEDRQKNPSAFKRGAGVWGNAFTSKLGWVKALGQLEWYYTWWSAEPDAAVAEYARQQDIEFVPMVFGRSSSKAGIPPSAKAVLGFNEPNVRGQSGLLPAEAARLWEPIRKEARSRGILLGSPSASPCPSLDNSPECILRSPFEWLDQWLAACKKANTTCDDFDFLATHFYSCSVDNLAAYLQELYQRYNKPIWLTEFSCCLNGSKLHSDEAIAKQITFARGAMKLLDSLPYVKRYSWFAPRTDGFACLGPSASLLTDKNELTTLGQLYVGDSVDAATLKEPVASAVAAPVPEVNASVTWSHACGNCDNSKTFHATLVSLKGSKSKYRGFVELCRKCGFEDEWNTKPLL